MKDKNIERIFIGICIVLFVSISCYISYSFGYEDGRLDVLIKWVNALKC